MNALSEAAHEHNLDVIQLEVLQGNTSAHNLYLSLGFEDIRRLLILEYKPETSSGLSPINPVSSSNTYEIRKLPSFHSLAPTNFPTHKTPKPWQRERQSLLPLEERLTAWLSIYDKQIGAYAIALISETAIRFMD